MGLEKGKPRKTFITIHHGHFAIRVDENTPDAIKRKLTMGENKDKEIWELHFQGLSGMIENINFVTGKFGDQIEVTVKDDREYSLQIPWKSSAKFGFLSRLPNVNPNQPVKLSVFKDEEKNRTVFVIYQNGALVPSKFTKDNPNGLPPLKEIKDFKGQVTWDSTERDAFLFDLLQSERGRFGGVLTQEELDTGIYTVEEAFPPIDEDNPPF